MKIVDRVALVGMKIHHKRRSTDTCFLFLTFRLPNREASSENSKLPSLKQKKNSLLFSEEASRFGRRNVKNKKQVFLMIN